MNRLMIRFNKLGLLLLSLALVGLLQACGKSESDKAKQTEQSPSPVVRKEAAKTPNQTQSGEAGTAAPSQQAQAPLPSFPTAVGRLVLVRGKVYIQRDKTGQQQSARVGAPIYLKDHIITTERGYARMRLRDDSVLRIAPTSNLAVTKQLIGGGHKNTTIDLLRGKLRALVVHKLKPGESFEVKTKVAVAGVRGTDFEVIADQGTVVRCYTGVVAIHNLDNKVQGHVLLTPDTYTFIAQEKPPIKPKRLPAYIKPMQDPPPLPSKPPLPPKASIKLPKAAVEAPEPVVSVPQKAQGQTTMRPKPAAPTPIPEPMAPVQPPKPPQITQALTQQLMDQGFDTSLKNLRHSDVQRLWEQDTDKPLHEMLYGDGLDGWMINPAQ